jgi:nitrogen fixation protein NifU and related proteins
MAKELDDFDNSFRELEKTVMDDMRQTFSEKVIDHFLNPRNLGQIPTPDGFGRVIGGCGDTMEIHLKVKDDRVVEAYFWTDGCGPSIASGSAVTELAKGKNVSDAQEISQQDILDALDGLPEENVHCALLAANTLKEAIRDYLASKKEPWKRAYEKS